MPAKKAPAKSSQSLEGKVAVITGASRGIGLAISEALAEAGCKLCVTARNNGPLQKAAQELKAYKTEIIAKNCDIGDPASVADFFQVVKKHFKIIIILINNAGLSHPLADIQELD